MHFLRLQVKASKNNYQKQREPMKTKLITTTLTATILSAAALVASIEDIHPQVQKIAALAASDKGIVKLNVALGQKVKKGDLLFELNPDINNAKLEWVEMDKKTIDPILKGAEMLIKGNHISAETYELVQYTDSDITTDENLFKSVIAASRYYAPFDGTVTKIYRYDGSGLGDNDDEVVVTEGNVKVDTANQVAMVCTPPWNTVIDLKVDLGQKVKKGDVLFTLRNMDMLQNQLEKDKSVLVKAEKKCKRQKVLYADKATSEFNMLVSEFDYHKALTDVKIDQIKIAQSTFYAPFDGTVTNIYRANGTGMGQGKPVLDITASK